MRPRLMALSGLLCVGLSGGCAAVQRAAPAPPAAVAVAAAEGGPSAASTTEPGVAEPGAESKGPSIADLLEERDRRRMTPDLDALAERIGDRDRADARFDWSAVRAIKNQYTLFNPTPRALRREFVTDRPDKTINPVTLDAGHVQVETDLATATFDRRQPRRPFAPGQPAPKTGTGGFLQQQPFTPGDKDDYVFLLTNVRVGLTNNADLHLFLRPFQRLTTPPGFGRPAVDAFGFGDVRVLMKENLWGNEGGPTAFALTQYLDIPAGRPDLSTGAVEGGATGTVLFRFPGKTYLGVEGGLEWRKDIFAGRYHAEVPASVSVAYSFTKELSAKAEFASQFSAEPGAQWVGVAALAVLYGLGDDAQLDVGINIGVTPAANDWNPYFGLAKRF